jgi:phosphatidylglycerophosphatase A
MIFKDKILMFLATGAFLGKIQVAPGTFGSLGALPFCWLLSKIDWVYTTAIIFVFVPFAISIAGSAEKILSKKDPGCIVIDEMAGLLVTFWGLSFNLFTAALGFALFRLFDIFKPYPIRTIEKKLPGGAGVVLDDVVAGIYGNLLLRSIIFLMSG